MIKKLLLTSALISASFICLPTQPLAPSAAFAQTFPTSPGWTQLTNTKIRSVCPDPTQYPTIQGAEGCAGVVTNWNSAAFDTTRNRLIVWGGGHNGYYGNELYALDLSDVTMKRITNPGLPAAPTTPCQEAIANGTQPNARHTYDGLAYMQHVDRLISVSGDPACNPTTVSTEIWTYSFATGTWQQMSPTGDNILLGFVKTDIEGTAVAYDSLSKFTFIDTRIGILTYDIATNMLKTRNNRGGHYRAFEGTSIIDPIRRYLYTIGGGQMWRWDISSITATNTTGTIPNPTLISSSGGSAIVSANHPGLAWDSANQQVVAWSGGNTAYALNGATNAWTATTFAGGPGAADGNGTFKRWAYSPASGAFVVVNSVDRDAFAFRLAAGAADTTAPTVPTGVSATTISASQIDLSWTAATDNVGVTGYRIFRNSTQISTTTSLQYSDTGISPSTTYVYTVVAVDAAGNVSSQSTSASATTGAQSSGGSDFQSRCAHPGVLVCQGWDQASSMTPAVYPNSGIYPGDSGTYANATRDASTFLSGSGSLRYRHPAGVANSNTVGSWSQSFGNTFSQNSHFYVQYAMRISPEYSANTVQWNSQWKHSIIYGGIQSPSCASIELTTVNYNYSDHPNLWPQMYTDCGGRSMYTRTDNQTYTENTPLLLQSTSQPGVRGYSCQYGSEVNGTGNGNGCFNFSQLTNKWITFYYDIQLGAWNTPTSKIKAYISFDGGPYLQWVNVTNMSLNFNNNPSEGYGAIILSPYMTSLSTSAPADAYMWYDDLVISSQPIAAPGSGGVSNPPPAAPTNLRVQ